MVSTTTGPRVVVGSLHFQPGSGMLSARPQHTCLGMCAGPMVLGLQRPCRAWPSEAWGISWSSAIAALPMPLEAH